MSAPPIPMVYEGEGHFATRPNFVRVAEAHFGAGEVVMMVPHEERSTATHNHEFAWLKEAWQNLPEDLASEYQTPEHLRKRALIRTGWCTVEDYVCASRAEALRWVENLRRILDAYTVIELSEGVVRVYRARSQARNAMGREDFQASKTAILEWVSALIGVEPQALLQARAA